MLLIYGFLHTIIEKIHIFPYFLLFSLFFVNFAPSPTIQNKMRKVLLLNMCFICSLFCYGQMTLSSCGLSDTKWRNDITGDFDIGFFEQFAVYDCKFWQYESVSEKGDKYDITLRHDDDLRSMKVGKDRNGKRDIQIGLDKPLPFSNITSQYLPYYPKSDGKTDLKRDGTIHVTPIVLWAEE